MHFAPLNKGSVFSSSRSAPAVIVLSAGVRVAAPARALTPPHQTQGRERPGVGRGGEESLGFTVCRVFGSSNMLGRLEFEQDLL